MVDGDAAMRPGPDVPVLAGPVTITPVVTAEFRGSSVIIPAWDVQVEASADRAVQTRVTFSAPPEYVPASWDAPLACFGQRVHIAARIASPRGEWDVQIGVYQIESWEESDDGHVSVEALDLTQRLEKNEMLWPSSPPEGATLASEVQRLAGEPIDGGIQTAVARNFSIHRLFEWGTGRLDAIQKLVESFGMIYRLTPDGVLHVTTPTPTDTAVATYTGRDLLISANRRSRERQPDRWMVTGSPKVDASERDDAGEKEEIKWAAVVDNWTDPRYRADTYGVVTSSNTMDIAESEDQIREAAETYMAASLAASEARALQIVTDPRLELGDVVDVRVTHLNSIEALRGRVTGYSMALDDPSQVMRVDIEIQDGR